MRIALLFAVSAGLCVVGNSQQAISAPVSSEPLTAERLSIYSDVLTAWNSGSKNGLNLAQTTEPFEADFKTDSSCLRAFRHRDVKTTLLHTFSPKAFPQNVAVLVDPASYRHRDIADFTAEDKPLDAAVDAATAAGLFSLSEIVFDRTRTHAAFSYSFVCGRLCGTGGTVIYLRRHGKWSKSRTRCSSWQS
jgi:hypothetical protein